MFFDHSDDDEDTFMEYSKVSFMKLGDCKRNWKNYRKRTKSIKRQTDSVIAIINISASEPESNTETENRQSNIVEK